MVLQGAGAAIEFGGILWKVLERFKAKKNLGELPVVKNPSPVQTAEEVLATIDKSPDVAVVEVKSSWFNVDNLHRVGTIIIALLALVFGREVISADLMDKIIAVLLALVPVLEWWRSRRRTSITKAAAVNILQKPKE